MVEHSQNLPVYPKIEMTDANPNEPMQIIATDTTPWAHIRLEIDGVAYELDRFTTD